MKYAEASKEAYNIMAVWMAIGGTLGFGSSYLLRKIPYIKDNYYVKKYRYRMLWICLIPLTYHGYKLMNFTKRKRLR